MSDQINRNEPNRSTAYDLLSKRITEVKASSKKKRDDVKPVPEERKPVFEKKEKVSTSDGHLRAKKALAIIAGILTAVIVVLAGFGAYLLTYKPNNQIPKETTNPAIGTDETVDTDSESESAQPVESETQVPIVNPTDLERKADCYNFLVLGTDNLSFNTDVIFLVSYNVADGEIAILQIPRDTYVEIQGKQVKANSIHPRMYGLARREGRGTTDAELTRIATEDTGNVFGANFNIIIDYYVFVNLRGVGEMVDLIGGVPMNVPYDMQYSDPGQNLYIDLKAGYQVLNGDQAQQFIRFRSGYLNADLGRLEAQKLFITALIKQVKDNMKLTTLIGLLDKLYQSVESTNISVADLTYFVKCFSTVQNTAIRFVTFPGGSWSPYVQVKKADMVNILDRFFNITTTPITADNFDPYKVFVNQGDSDALSVYNTPAVDLATYVRNAQDIDENGIKVPLKKKSS